jgi:hypothetical protein
MLALSLSIFAALVPSAVSAVARDVPAKLALPQGTALVGKYAAKGVQIYVCRAKGAATEWSFEAPEAALVDSEGRPFARHMPVRPGKRRTARRSSARF